MATGEFVAVGMLPPHGSWSYGAVSRSNGDDTRDDGDALHTVAKLPTHDTDPREQVRANLCSCASGGAGECCAVLCNWCMLAHVFVV
jgi:hypothetical protein